MRKAHLWSVMLVTSVAIGAQTAAVAQARPEYPLYCAGIVVGMTTDTDVRRMYGEGLFVEGEGHLGGRYYVDPGRRVTLHVVIGVDQIVESVSYSRGIRLPNAERNGATVPKEAISPRLTAHERISGGHRLGDAASHILRDLGKPHSDTRYRSARALRYQADEETMAYVLVYEAEFRFVNNRLVWVRLYNGE